MEFQPPKARTCAANQLLLLTPNLGHFDKFSTIFFKQLNKDITFSIAVAVPGFVHFNTQRLTEKGKLQIPNIQINMGIFRFTKFVCSPYLYGVLHTHHLQALGVLMESKWTQSIISVRASSVTSLTNYFSVLSSVKLDFKLKPGNHKQRQTPLLK